MLLRLAGRSVASDGDGMTVSIGMQLPKVSRTIDKISVVGTRYAISIPRAAFASFDVSATVERQFYSYAAAAKFQAAHIRELNLDSGDLEVIDVFGVAYSLKNAVLEGCEFEQTGLHLKTAYNFSTGGIK